MKQQAERKALAQIRAAAGKRVRAPFGLPHALAADRNVGQLQEKQCA